MNPELWRLIQKELLKKNNNNVFLYLFIYLFSFSI